MRFSKGCAAVAVIAVWLGGALAAHAQVGLYGVYSASQLSSIQCFDPQGHCSSGGGKVNPSGLTGGIYYDFKSFGPVRLGLDARAGFGHANKSATSSAGGDNITGTQSFLLGVRGSFHTPLPWLKPYAQVSAGYARSDATEPINQTLLTGSYVPPRTYDNFVQYEVFAGADIPILPIVDLRAIELGIGNMNRFGTGSGSSSVPVKSIGIGVVFHLP